MSSGTTARQRQTTTNTSVSNDSIKKLSTSNVVNRLASNTNNSIKTAPTTSKASTPLLQPTRAIPQAHIRHQKSNSMASVSDKRSSHIPLSTAPNYLKKNQNVVPDKSTPLKSLGLLGSVNYPPASKSTLANPTNKTVTSVTSSPNLNSLKRVSALSKSSVSLNSTKSSLTPKASTISKTSSNVVERLTAPKVNRLTVSGTLKASSSHRITTAKVSQAQTLNNTATVRKSSLTSGTSLENKGSIESKPKAIPVSSKIPIKSVTGTATKPIASGSLPSRIPKPTVGAGAIQPSTKSSVVNGVVKKSVASVKPTVTPLRPLVARSSTLSASVSNGAHRPLNSLNKSSTINIAPTRSSALKAATTGSISRVAPITSANKLSTVTSRKSSTASTPSTDAPKKSTNASTLLSTTNTRTMLLDESLNEEQIKSEHGNGIPKESPAAISLSKKLSSLSKYVPKAVPKELSRIPEPPSNYASKSRKGELSLDTINVAPNSEGSSNQLINKHLNSPITQSREVTSSSLSQQSSSYVADSFTPADILLTFRSKLSKYEQSEILSYSHIYYFGMNAKHPDWRRGQGETGAYDTNEGDYTYTIGDHLAYRYEIRKPLGKGSFGQVIKAYDYKYGRDVAIKIIRSSERFHRQALTEIQLLQSIARWDPQNEACVVHILDQFSFRGHLCIVTELYRINLYEYIKAGNFRGYKENHVKELASQILKCLLMLRQRHVIHCDLKPENILLTGASFNQVKVIDFGSSCFTNQRIYTYIQSRFYRSPEVILELPYGTPIDMWSLGCILVELSTGHPVFPGETESEQLACIMEVLGIPDSNLVARSRRRFSFFDINGNPRTSLSPRKKRVPGSRPLALFMRGCSEVYVDFLLKCFEYDPEKRIKPEEAMRHPWLAHMFPNLQEPCIQEYANPSLTPQEQRSVTREAKESMEANLQPSRSTDKEPIPVPKSSATLDSKPDTPLLEISSPTLLTKQEASVVGSDV